MLRYLKISFGSALIVLTTIWTLCFIATINAKNTLPKPILLNHKGTVLRPAQIIPSNNQNLQPRDLENQTDHFDYTFGRKILKEQQERYLSDWTPSASLTWNFKHAPEGNYKITLKYRSKQKSNITVNAFGQIIQFNTPITQEWKYLSQTVHLKNNQETSFIIENTLNAIDIMSVTLNKKT